MLKRISVEHLRTGVFIHELCGSWMEHPFWRKSFLLAKQKDVDTISRRRARIPAQGQERQRHGPGCLPASSREDGRQRLPHRLRDEGISLFARMGLVCDVYDAITSNRPYKAGWDPAESMRKMALWSPGRFDERVFQAFVKCVGIYPTGSLVKLESGRLGVVVEQTEGALLTPKVRVFFSTHSSTYISPERVDLARPGCQDRIVGREDAERWGKNVERMWMTAA